MMEFFLIYLYIVLNNLASAAEPLAVFSGMGIVMVAAGELGSRAHKNVELTTTLVGIRNVLIKAVFIPAILVLCIVPSKEDIAWIVGGGIAWNIATTEEAKQLPENLLRVTNRFLEGIQEREE